MPACLCDDVADLAVEQLPHVLGRDVSQLVETIRNHLLWFFCGTRSVATFLHFLMAVLGKLPGIRAGLLRGQSFLVGLGLADLNALPLDCLVVSFGDRLLGQRSWFGESESVDRCPPVDTTAVQTVQLDAQRIAFGQR